MAIGEAQLTTWTARGSITQSADTQEPIRRVLESANAPYSNRVYESYLHGSYGNDTNVYSESDVDIVMQMNSTWYYDISRLDAQQTAAFHATFRDGSHSQNTFKADVAAWLSRHYNGVVEGDKAIFVPGNGNRRDADVLACAQFRRYYTFTVGAPDTDFVPGICFFLPNGQRIENFPRQHLANCTTKHQNTNNRFKPTVRMFKNLRNRMVRDGQLADGVAPSYFIEGMLSNVPNPKFVVGWQDTFVNCFNWLDGIADKSTLNTASGLHKLVFDGYRECWPQQDCDTFFAAVKRTWSSWT
jgi:hypothetical protein